MVPVMAPPLGRIEERAFQMDADDGALRTRVDDVGDRTDRSGHPVELVGDETGEGTRRAVAAMEGHRGQDLLCIVGGDLRATSAVHVQIDEARHEVSAVEIMNVAIADGRIAGADPRDGGTVHDQPTRVQDPPGRHHAGVGENGHRTDLQSTTGCQARGLRWVTTPAGVRPGCGPDGPVHLETR